MTIKNISKIGLVFFGLLFLIPQVSAGSKHWTPLSPDNSEIRSPYPYHSKEMVLHHHGGSLKFDEKNSRMFNNGIQRGRHHKQMFRRDHPHQIELSRPHKKTSSLGFINSCDR